MHMMRYYKVTGKKLKEQINKSYQQRLSSCEKARQFCEQHGFDSYYTNGSNIVGFIPKTGENPIGVGWRWDRDRMIKPNKRTPEGRKYAKEIDTMRMPDGWDLSRIIGHDVMTPENRQGISIFFPGYHYLEDQDTFLVEVRCGKDPEPKNGGLRRISDRQFEKLIKETLCTTSF